MPEVTLGSGLEYEVYADLDTANVYLAAQFDATAWRAADATTQGRGLVTGTRQIDAQAWQGEKTDPDQALAFPRTGLTYADGSPVPSDAVPQEVIDANCLLAADILDGTAAANAAAALSGTRRLKAGSAEIEYFRPIIGEEGGVFPLDVLKLIGQWLAGASGGAGSVSTGTDCPSQFRRGYGIRPF